MQLTGIHHLTAVTADAPGNYAFYTGTLGMRLVKKTVNQDDVSAYHLFYADAAGTPGTDLTFFDWRVDRERPGTGSIVRTGLRVADEAALDWWSGHLEASGVAHSGVIEREGYKVIDFTDPEGQRLRLVAAGPDAASRPWKDSPIPQGHRILGLGPLTLSVPRLEPTHRVLTEVLNLRAVRRHPREDGSTVQVYEMGGGGPAAQLHVVEESGAPGARPGAGGVHHLALRTPDAEQYEAWTDRLGRSGLPFSGPVDRYYFRSLYLREPGGVLIEIATDGPGFAVDEPAETLGESLALPPFLEARRGEIEAGLKPLETAARQGRGEG